MRTPSSTMCRGSSSAISDGGDFTATDRAIAWSSRRPSAVRKLVRISNIATDSVLRVEKEAVGPDVGPQLPRRAVLRLYGRSHRPGGIGTALSRLPYARSTRQR